MTHFRLAEKTPLLTDADSNYFAPGSIVIGNVTIGKNVSIWSYAVVRGDVAQILIGDGTNIQEHSMLHCDLGFPLTIGENCTIGHRAIVHGCTIGENTMIGMGAIVLNGVKIGKNCLVGAGALLTEGKEFPDGSLIVGFPARAVRSLDDQAIARLTMSALHYVASGRRFKLDLSEV